MMGKQLSTADADQIPDTQGGDLSAFVRVLAEANWLDLSRYSAGLTIDRVALSTREQFGLLSYCPGDMGGASQGVLCSGDLTIPLLYFSDDQGARWTAVSLADHLQRPVKRHFLTRSGRHLVQTGAPTETLLLDAKGVPITRVAMGDTPWPGRFSIDQAPSKTIMIAVGTKVGGSTILKSIDDGQTWKPVALPGLAGGEAIARSCQADPHIPGRWYAGGNALWSSDDDGARWREIPLKPMRKPNDLTTLPPAKGVSIGESHLIWLVAQANGPSMIARLDKSDNTLELTQLPGTRNPVAYLQLDSKRGVAIAESADDKTGGLATLIDYAEDETGEIKVKRLSWQRNRFSELSLGGSGRDGVFFAGIDSGRPNSLENRTLRLRVGISPWLVDDAVPGARRPLSAVGSYCLSEGFKPKDDDLLAFFHPQRTAGMSLRNLFIKVYGADHVMSPKTSPQFRNWAELAAHQFEPFKVYCGHVNFIEKPLGSRRCVPIGMVRNPADRLISLYRYIRGRGEGHKLWDLAQNLDIASFYLQAAEVMPEYVMNLQTRRVSGGTDADKAIELVQKRFLAVGVNEYIDDFVGFLRLALGWPENATITHRNKAQTPLDFEIPAAFHSWVRETNADDMKLYEHVLAIWKGRAATDQGVAT